MNFLSVADFLLLFRCFLYQKFFQRCNHFHDFSRCQKISKISVFNHSAIAKSFHQLHSLSYVVPAHDARPAIGEIPNYLYRGQDFIYLRGFISMSSASNPSKFDCGVCTMYRIFFLLFYLQADI